MRLILSTIIALIISGIGFLIIKLWGQGQVYAHFEHPFFTKDQVIQLKHLTPEMVSNQIDLSPYDGVYINIVQTKDLKLAFINPVHEAEKKIVNKKSFHFHNRDLAELADNTKDSAVDLMTLLPLLQNKKIIINLIENPLQFTDVFKKFLKDAGWESGSNFIFTSNYEPPTKILKEEIPHYLYGSTEPEILKIKAMEGLYLLEAATIRADAVIYPVKFYSQYFFTETLIQDLKRRHKRFIIGPISIEEKEAVLKLKPDGIILR